MALAAVGAWLLVSGPDQHTTRSGLRIDTRVTRKPRRL